MNTWYDTLIKPSFVPPDYIFIIVWSILYILMAISFVIILAQKNKPKKFAVTMFIIQFILNIIWSPLFFNLYRIDLAFVDIILLWFFILMMLFAFYKNSKIAAFLQIPYFIWVTFAIYLNFRFLLLN